MPLHPSPTPYPDTPSSGITTNDKSLSDFVLTLEHRRFVEFCEACRRYRYIGLCYGTPGVGKTCSTRFYSGCPSNDGEAALEDGICRTVFYTPSVVNQPHLVDREIRRCREQLRAQALQTLRQERREKLEAVRQREAEQTVGTGSDRFTGDPITWVRPGYGPVLEEFAAREQQVADPTTLILIDETDRLREASLEQVRAIFDVGDIGLVLIGMPGLEKRLARYPQLYSRIGFVHEFRPLGAAEVRRLLEQPWVPAGVCLPPHPFNAEATAALIRMTGGNFRLLHRLLAQIERVLEINRMSEVTQAVVEAAREALVIGEA